MFSPLQSYLISAVFEWYSFQPQIVIRWLSWFSSRIPAWMFQVAILFNIFNNLCLSWFVMVYHNIYIYIYIRIIICIYIIVLIYDDLWWFIMIYDDLSWFIMIYPVYVSGSLSPRAFFSSPLFPFPQPFSKRPHSPKAKIYRALEMSTFQGFLGFRAWWRVGEVFGVPVFRAMLRGYSSNFCLVLYSTYSTSSWGAWNCICKFRVFLSFYGSTL